MTAAQIRKVVLAAGGTGGHMFPAEALARELRARGVLVRPMNAYHLPSCLRVTIGTEQQMAVVGDLIETIVQSLEATGE